MTNQTKSLFEQARQLSATERQELAEMLLDTLEPDPSTEAAWGEEAHHRWDEHLASDGKTIDAFDAVEDARRQLTSGR